MVQRARSASVGQEVKVQCQRGGRMKIDIKTDQPIILIPESSNSYNLIIANLGNLTLKCKISFKLKKKIHN